MSQLYTFTFLDAKNNVRGLSMGAVPNLATALCKANLFARDHGLKLFEYQAARVCLEPWVPGTLVSDPVDLNNADNPDIDVSEAVSTCNNLFKRLGVGIKPSKTGK